MTGIDNGCSLVLAERLDSARPILFEAGAVRCVMRRHSRIRVLANIGGEWRMSQNGFPRPFRSIGEPSASLHCSVIREPNVRVRVAHFRFASTLGR